MRHGPTGPSPLGCGKPEGAKALLPGNPGRKGFQGGERNLAFREPPSTGEVAQTPVEKPIGQKQLITSSFRKKKKFVCMYYIPRKSIPAFSLLRVFVLRAHGHDPSRGCQHNEVKLMSWRTLFCHFSRSPSCTSSFRPIALSLTCARGSPRFPPSVITRISSSPTQPCFTLTVGNQTMTLEHGRQELVLCLSSSPCWRS